MAPSSGLLCAVDGCRSSKRRDKNLSFFHLPADEETRKTWIELIGREDLARPGTKRKSHVVCSLHFDPSVIKYKPQLLPKALPTISIPSSQPTTSESSNEPKTKMDENSNTSDDDSESQEVKSAADENNDEDTTVTCNPSASVAKNQKVLVSSHKLYEKGNISEKIDQILKAIVKIDDMANSADKNGDEFDTFGKYIATTLRSLPGELSIAAKIDIQKAIAEIQLKALKQASQPSILSYGTATTATYDPLNPGYLILKPEPYADEDMSNITFTTDS